MTGQGRLLVVAPDRWRLVGALDFDAVTDLSRQGRHLLSQAARQGLKRLTIDLQGVESANSAALALLLEWLELTKQQGLELVYAHLPEPLLRLARLSNLDGLLPLADPLA